MADFRYEYQSDFARKYYGQGRAEATAQALLTVLQRRGLEPSEAQRARILTCADPGVLERWFDRAFDVSAIEDLFA